MSSAICHYVVWVETKPSLLCMVIMQLTTRKRYNQINIFLVNSNFWQLHLQGVLIAVLHINVRETLLFLQLLSTRESSNNEISQ